MYPRTLRRNGCCSNQRSFHQLPKVVGKNGLEWWAVVEKKLKKLYYTWWNQEVKETIRAKKDAFKTWIQDRWSSDLQSRYTEARKSATPAVKKFKKS